MMRILALLIAAFMTLSVAGVDPFEFASAEDEQRFKELTSTLRCPKCENQSIYDSNAMSARTMKEIVFEQINAGKTDAEIRAFMQERYGDFVLYKPPVNAQNSVLWFAPVMLLVFVLAVAALRVIRHRSKSGRQLS